ncbi:RHS repeat-associated core domain-containing protein [Lelliottia nimipressuralis]
MTPTSHANCVFRVSTRMKNPGCITRYYDCETGQYISPDPIGLAGGINPYGYVHNPLGWIDPLGLVCCASFDAGNE